MNKKNLRILYNMTFRMLVNIHFQKWPSIFTTIYIIVKRGSGTEIEKTNLNNESIKSYS